MTGTERATYLLRRYFDEGLSVDEAAELNDILSTSDEAATAHLNAMAAMSGLPWPLTFSYSRALQNAALKTWRGQAANVAAAQKAFYHRAHMNALAAQGKWNSELERQAA